MKPRTIEPMQAFQLLSLMLFTKVFFSGIKTLCQQAGPAAWQLSLLSTLTALGGFALVWGLCRRFPGQDLVEISFSLLGPWGGRILCLLFVGYGLYYCGINAREVGELIKTYHLVQTPSVLIQALLLFTVALVALRGLAPLLHLSSLCFWPIVAGLALILLLCLPQYHAANLAPFWGYGFSSTLTAGLFRSSAYGDIVMLLVLAPYLKTPKTLGKTGVAAILFGGGLIALTCLCYTLAMPYTISGYFLSPVLEMAKRVYFSRFFQRIDAIFLFVFILSSVINLAAYFYFCQHIFCKAFAIPRWRLTTFPFYGVVSALSTWPENLTQLLTFHLVLVRQYSFPLTFLLPGVLLLLALWKQKKGGALSCCEKS